MLQLKNLADSLPASFCPRGIGLELVLDGLYSRKSSNRKTSKKS